MFNLIDEIIIQHLGFIFTFLALSVRDMLRLRIILAIAQILAGVYQVMIGRYDVVIWNAVFTIVNFYHIVRIINERRIVFIPEEIKDIYENIFGDFTTKEFMNFWNLGNYKNSSNSLIIKEGEKQYNLLLILNGDVTVKREDQILNKLGRGKFIAEMSLITNEPATANIYSNKNVRYISWNQDELKHFQVSNKDLWIKLHNILSKDLIQKIKSTSHNN
mgnify:CR=1 FL=1|tara:strand:- start:2977 stop:3630 length:654 start_codon:yes stop_codon:yes gene_type:complete